MRTRASGSREAVLQTDEPASERPSRPVEHVQQLEFAGTCLEGLPLEVIRRLLVRSSIRDVDRGKPIFPAFDQAPRIGLVLQGTVRSFVTAADGRQLTVRYSRRGALIGKHATVVGAHPPLGVHAFTDSIVLEFDADVFSACAATEISLSNAVILELGRRFEDVYAAIADSAFGSIRQRIVRHLLALAGDLDDPLGGRVAITQQELADAIGSTRVVVTRALGELRDESLIQTDQGFVRLLSPDRLVSSLNSWQKESPY